MTCRDQTRVGDEAPQGTVIIMNHAMTAILYNFGANANANANADADVWRQTTGRPFT